MRSRLVTGGALAIVDGGGALAIVDGGGGALAIVDGGIHYHNAAGS